MPVYLASNLTILLGRSKVARPFTSWTEGKAVGYLEVSGSRLVEIAGIDSL